MKIERVEKVKAVRFTANFDAFAKQMREDGRPEERIVEEWQRSYFQLIGWKNYWSLALELDIRAGRRDNGYYEPFVDLVVKKELEEKTEEMLKDLGYVIKKCDITVAFIEPEWDERIDEYYIDF